MANRKKKLKKGIASIQKQIEKHEIKKQNALKEGQLELAGYYDAELAGLERAEKRKKALLDK